MKAIRVLEYDGPKEWIEDTILRRAVGIRGEPLCCGPGKYIREISVTYSDEEKKEETSNGK